MNQTIVRTHRAVRHITALLLLTSSIAVWAKSAPPDDTFIQDHVQARIVDLHAKLQINGSQEEQWKQVAQVMTENAQIIAPLINERTLHADSMTAIDDLKSYSAITDAHAEGIKRFIPVFSALYAGMSDIQKKKADSLFRQIKHSAAGRKDAK